MGAAELTLAREFVERYNARDIEGLVSICDPEVEARSIYAGLESGGVFRTPDGFPRAYFEAIDEAWSFFQLVDPAYEDLGPVVLISCRMWGRGVGSGAEMREQIYVVWKMRNDRLWLECTLTDEHEARRLAEWWAEGHDDYPSQP